MAQPQQTNPWLQLAVDAKELLSKEPPSGTGIHPTHGMQSLSADCPSFARGGNGAMNKPQLTPAQQALMNYLDKLATSPYSVGLMQEGNRILDSAVSENQRLQDSIHQVSNAMRNAQKCAELDKEVQR